MTHVTHHQNLRKRIHSKKERYPHPNKRIAYFDRLMIALGALNAVATLPQVLEIWIGQDASGVSLISWSYYCFYATMFLIYGFIHKELPIIVAYSLALALYILIVIGTLIYS
jgi:MtN3 and saliva related transmembrane protein